MTVTATSKTTAVGTTTTTAIATNTAVAVTATVTSGTVCATTSTVTSFPTIVNYQVRGTPGAGQIAKRADLLSSCPPEFIKGCKPASLPAKVSSACSCLLAKATPKTTTVTATSTTSVGATATVTSFATVTSTVISTVNSCSSTSIAYVYNVPEFTCGVANPTSAGASGTIACPSASAAQATSAYFRIEGGSEGNIFDGCIASDPRSITTPSGGTHKCDGTNNNANPNPGATLTTQLDQASNQEGFRYDGSYSATFVDYFITSIDVSTQTGNQYWGVLLDRVFTQGGGCQTQFSPAQEGLWAYDAFAPNRMFLSISPQYQVVRSGETSSVVLNVQNTNPNNGDTSPRAGATVGGSTVSDASGNLQLTVPTEPGCYQYKAEVSNAIRSNAFYLTVLPAAT